MAQTMHAETIAEMLRPETTRLAREWMSEYIAPMLEEAVEAPAAASIATLARRFFDAIADKYGTQDAATGEGWCPRSYGAVEAWTTLAGALHAPRAAAAVDVEGLALVVGDRIATALAPIIAEHSAIPALVRAVEEGETRIEAGILAGIERERALVRKLVGVVTDLQRVEVEAARALEEFRSIYEPSNVTTELRRRAWTVPDNARQPASRELLPGEAPPKKECAAGCGSPRLERRATCGALTCAQAYVDGALTCAQAYVDALSTRPRPRE